MDNEYTSFKNSTERDEFLKKYNYYLKTPQREKKFFIIKVDTYQSQPCAQF